MSSSPDTLNRLEAAGHQHRGATGACGLGGSASLLSRDAQLDETGLRSGLTPRRERQHRETQLPGVTFTPAGREAPFGDTDGGLR
jgi:hypothetical protein